MCNNFDGYPVGSIFEGRRERDYLETRKRSSAYLRVRVWTGRTLGIGICRTHEISIVARIGTSVKVNGNHLDFFTVLTDLQTLYPFIFIRKFILLS